MDVKGMRSFVVVYETGSFSGAAEILGTVQSNVSERIMALEGVLGEPLFVRRWRGVAPTPKGKTFYAFAKDVLAKLEEGARAFKLRVE
jgi:DNA-binding transcriptional LysR family regulator